MKRASARDFFLFLISRTRTRPTGPSFFLLHLARFPQWHKGYIVPRPLSTSLLLPQPGARRLLILRKYEYIYVVCNIYIFIHLYTFPSTNDGGIYKNVQEVPQLLSQSRRPSPEYSYNLSTASPNPRSLYSYIHNSSLFFLPTHTPHLRIPLMIIPSGSPILYNFFNFTFHPRGFFIIKHCVIITDPKKKYCLTTININP